MICESCRDYADGLLAFHCEIKNCPCQHKEGEWKDLFSVEPLDLHEDSKRDS